MSQHHIVSSLCCWRFRLFSWRSGIDGIFQPSSLTRQGYAISDGSFMEGFSFCFVQSCVFVVIELDERVEIGIEGVELFRKWKVERVGYEWFRDTIFDFETW